MDGYDFPPPVPCDDLWEEPTPFDVPVQKPQMALQLPDQKHHPDESRESDLSSSSIEDVMESECTSFQDTSQIAVCSESMPREGSTRHLRNEMEKIKRKLADDVSWHQGAVEDLVECLANRMESYYGLSTNPLITREFFQECAWQAFRPRLCADLFKNIKIQQRNRTNNKGGRHVNGRLSKPQHCYRSKRLTATSGLRKRTEAAISSSPSSSPGSCHEVEMILDKRPDPNAEFPPRIPSDFEYRIKWKGFPESEATWEPYKNLCGCLEMLAEFLSKH